MSRLRCRHRLGHDVGLLRGTPAEPGDQQGVGAVQEPESRHLEGEDGDDPLEQHGEEHEAGPLDPIGNLGEEGDDQQDDGQQRDEHRADAVDEHPEQERFRACDSEK